MEDNKYKREFEGNIDGVPHTFIAEEQAQNGMIYLSVFPKETSDFNEEDPRIRLRMENKMPAKYELLRSIGIILDNREITRIVHETLTYFGK